MHFLVANSFDEWRSQARVLLAGAVAPKQVAWAEPTECQGLLPLGQATPELARVAGETLRIPAAFVDLAREVARLGEAAKTGKASRDELTGSSFTISSLGTIGGVLATPIINFPEVGIMGVHAIRKTPIVNDNEEIVIGHMMNLSVSLDHRVVDGHVGASFLQEVRRYLEDPTLLLLAGI